MIHLRGIAMLAALVTAEVMTLSYAISALF